MKVLAFSDGPLSFLETNPAGCWKPQYSLAKVEVHEPSLAFFAGGLGAELHFFLCCLAGVRLLFLTVVCRPLLCPLARERSLLDAFIIYDHLHFGFAGSFSFRFRIHEQDENQRTHRHVITQVLWFWSVGLLSTFQSLLIFFYRYFSEL